MSVLSVLHLEDSALDSELIEATLDSEDIKCSIQRVWTRAAFEESLRHRQFDLILSDFSLPGFDGLSALKIARTTRPEIPFIFVSGTIGEERAIDSLQNGAVDYVLKHRLNRLGPAIKRARSEINAKAELRRNHDLLQRQAHLLDEARDAIFVRNLDQIVTYWNKGAERVYGWPASEIIGRKASEMLYKIDAPRRDEIWKAVLRDGEWRGELMQVTRDQRDICVMSRRTLLRDAAGNPEGVLNINTDITEKKSLEEQALRSQRMDSIGALAGGIAHDLNNVLAPIVMATELLADQQPDADCARMLDIVRNSAQRGAELVKQILQFARGSQRGDQTVDLLPLIKEMAKFISKTFPPMIRIEADFDGPAEVTGDPTQLHQALLNLCVNARDAMPRGGQITIRSRHVELANRQFLSQPQPVSGSFIELSVTDTGEGIPPQILGRIFEPFFTTKAEGKGTGLGLSTVISVVRNHRGYVEVNSEVGKGAAFALYFPVAAQKKPVCSDNPAPVPMGHGETILLIDDEAALLEMTRQLLEAHNYKTLTASNGAEGLLVFEEHASEISAIITDLLMAQLDGFELISTVRERNPNLFIICMSGSVEACSDAAKLAGTNVFLRKPCRTHDLLTALARLRKA